MTTFIDAPTLKSWLHDGRELALFDLREAGQFGEGHLFFAVPLPYSRLELDLGRLAPRRGVRMVMVDEGNGSAARAASRAMALGYSDVRVLRDGTDAWQKAGYQLFKGVNVVSKTFGELVEHEFATPSIAATELASRLRQGDDLIVVDGRPVDEYRKMSIPGAVCCPNGELALRIAELAPDPATTIVVNCAGRTRSIIGAETLRQLGVANPVVALRGGTMGWRLAGFDLDHGANRTYPEPPPERRAAVRRRAAEIARRHELCLIDAARARAWLADPQRTTYLLDVRTGEEFADGHLPGAQHAPGGQLVQATDHWLGVRRGRVILLDDSTIRGVMVAYWLQLIGWEVAVLDGAAAVWRELADAVPPVPPTDALLPNLTPVAPADIGGCSRSMVLLDLRPSQAYRAGHVAGARWAIRPRSAGAIADAPADAAIVLAASDPTIARAFAGDLPTERLQRACLLSGGVDAWREAGLDIVATPDDPPDSACIDYLFFVHDRHAGNLDAARRYLAWETGLAAQLDEQERATFRFAGVRV